MQPIGTQGWFHLDALTLRRSALDKAEWFSNLRLSQDTLFAVQLAATCRIASGQTGTPVALRGVHGSNRIQDPARMRAARRTVYLRLLAWARRRRLPPDQRRAIQRLNLSGLERPGQWLRVFWTDPQTLLHSRVRDVLRRTWNRIFRRSAVR